MLCSQAKVEECILVGWGVEKREEMRRRKLK
jgi:hypothetical protein